MKKLLISCSFILITGCANVLQTGSISDAYKRYEAEDYEKTLELITLARSINNTSPELIAELTFLKAKAYEKMGQLETAQTLFEYLKDQHINSQYGYLAAKSLEDDDG